MINGRPTNERCGWRTRDMPSEDISDQTRRLDILSSQCTSTLETITEDPLSEPNESERITRDLDYLHGLEFESPVSRTPSPPSIFRRQIMESSTALLSSSTVLQDQNVLGQPVSDMISSEHSAKTTGLGVDKTAIMFDEAPEWISPMFDRDVDGRRTIKFTPMLNGTEFLTSNGEQTQQVGWESWLRRASSASLMREMPSRGRLQEINTTAPQHVLQSGCSAAASSKH